MRLNPKKSRQDTVSTYVILHALLCFGLTIAAPTISSAHSLPYATVQTIEGCGTKELALYVDAVVKSISWSGKCSNGLIEGTGHYVVVSKSGESSGQWGTWHSGVREDSPGNYIYSESSAPASPDSYLLFNPSSEKISEEDCLKAAKCALIHKARMATPGNASDNKQDNLTVGEFIGTADGFEFSFGDARYQLSDQVVVGKGGPCAGAGIDAFAITHPPSSYYSYRKGTFRKDYSLTAYGQIPDAPSLFGHFNLNPMVDWKGTRQAVREQPEADRRRTECLARNHDKYVEAAEHWMELNKNAIVKKWKAWFKEREQLDAGVNKSK